MRGWQGPPGRSPGLLVWKAEPWTRSRCLWNVPSPAIGDSGTSSLVGLLLESNRSSPLAPGPPDVGAQTPWDPTHSGRSHTGLEFLRAATEDASCARHSAEHFTCIVSFHRLLFPLHRRGMRKSSQGTRLPNTAHSEPGPGRRLEAALSEHVGLHATLQPAMVAMTWGGPRKLPQRKGHPPPTACVLMTRVDEGRKRAPGQSLRRVP